MALIPINGIQAYTHPATSGGPFVGSFGSSVAPWAAGWSGPDEGFNAAEPTPLPVTSIPAGMTQVGALGGYSNPQSASTSQGATYGSGGFAAQSAMADLATSMPQPNTPATNLAPITVTANSMSLPPIGGVAGIGSPTSGSPSAGGVTNLSPVQVLADFKQNHPALYQLAMTGLNIATGGATALPGMVVNAFVDRANGKSMLGSFLPDFSGIGSALSGFGSGGGASTSNANPPTLDPSMFSNVPSASTTIGGAGGAQGGIATGGSLPSYAGLGSLAGFGNAPIGGYWNQQALKMANPAYGPYAGFGGSKPQPINYANPYAPSGITMAGY